MVHATARSLADNVGLVATTLIAAGVIWRYIARPLWRTWKAFRVRLHIVVDLIERELTHNGGSSLKDAVHRTDRNVAELDSEVTAIKQKGDETGDAVEALAQVMDHIIDRKQEDHERLWDAIRRLGGADPRKAKP